MKKRYEVIGTDANGDIWVVRSDRKDTADSIAQKFKSDGMTDVALKEIKT